MPKRHIKSYNTEIHPLTSLSRSPFSSRKIGNSYFFYFCGKKKVEIKLISISSFLFNFTIFTEHLMHICDNIISYLKPNY